MANAEQVKALVKSIANGDEEHFVSVALQIAASEANPLDGPAVCHLDTGINSGHPLLQFAVQDQHVIAVDPDWHLADIRGHGTEMAGLALWGCLTDALNSDGVIRLNHCLESVKLLPNQGANDPDLYGEITSQAVSRIRIAASDRDARDRKSTRLNSSHERRSRMPSSA